MKYDLQRFQMLSYRVAVLLFLLIQPLKLLGAYLGQNLLFVLILPSIPYCAVLLAGGKALKAHLIIGGVQVLLCGHSYLVSGEVWLDFIYFALFILTPHFAALIFFTYSERLRLFTLRCFATYIAVLCLLIIFSWYMYSKNNSVDLMGLFSPDMLMRNADNERWQVLHAMNIGRNIFGFDNLALEATALTIYPLVILSFLYLFGGAGAWCIPLILLSLGVVILKSSRAELLYVVSLGLGAVVARLWRPWMRFGIIPIIAFPFAQLFLEGRFLSGRSILNQIFLANHNLWGHGIGFTRRTVLAATHGDYGSIHNVHFELILNFGWVIYSILLTGGIFLLIRAKGVKVFVAGVALFFVLLATNYEIVDIYIGVLTAYLIKREIDFERRIPTT